MRTKILVGLMGLLLLGLVVLPATWVFAQTGGTLRACVKGTRLTKIGTNPTCSSREQLLEWNIQGEPGPQGPQGTPGVLGFYRRVVTADAFVNKSLVAVCGAGDRAVGGGFDLGNFPPGADVKALASFPGSSGTSWAVTIQNDEDFLFTWAVYVVCADMP